MTAKVTFDFGALNYSKIQLYQFSSGLVLRNNFDCCCSFGSSSLI